MKKFLKYYLFFIITILILIFVDNIIGLAILVVLLIAHYKKIIEMWNKIMKK